MTLFVSIGITFVSSIYSGSFSPLSLSNLLLLKNLVCLCRSLSPPNVHLLLSLPVIVQPQAPQLSACHTSQAPHTNLLTCKKRRQYNQGNQYHLEFVILNQILGEPCRNTWVESFSQDPDLYALPSFGCQKVCILIAIFINVQMVKTNIFQSSSYIFFH